MNTSTQPSEPSLSPDPREHPQTGDGLDALIIELEVRMQAMTPAITDQACSVNALCPDTAGCTNYCTYGDCGGSDGDCTYNCTHQCTGTCAA